jgi:hypothetical protein
LGQDDKLGTSTILILTKKSQVTQERLSSQERKRKRKSIRSYKRGNKMAENHRQPDVKEKQQTVLSSSPPYKEREEKLKTPS